MLQPRGDTVRMLREPRWEGVVLDTFYENGEGGMHVSYEHLCSWTCYRDVEIVHRAELVATSSP